jgi:hypothetical protein
MRVNIFGMERTPHLFENLAGHYSASLILLLLISEPTPHPSPFSAPLLSDFDPLHVNTGIT